MESLRKRQKKWIRHVLRHDSLLQKVIEGRFQGKKTPGRPRTMLLDALMQEDEESVIDYAKLKEKAHDRVKLGVNEKEQLQQTDRHSQCPMESTRTVHHNDTHSRLAC